MYKSILVTLDHSPADETILQHIEELHKFIPGNIILLHVADGWAARHFNELKLKESEEIKKDRAYLASVEKRLQDKGITATAHLAMGEPADQIIKFAQKHHCDLIAMSTHGHRFIEDFLLGTTATKVRHRVDIPILLVKARK